MKSIKKSIALAAIICFANNFINAQDLGYVDTTQSNTITINIDSLKKIYEENVLYIQKGMLVQGKKMIRPGFLYKRYKKLIVDSTDALVDYKTYRKKTVQGLTLLIGSFVIIVPLAIVAGSVGAPALITVWFVPYIIGLSKLGNAPNYLQSSIWKNNRDILIQKLKLKKH